MNYIFLVALFKNKVRRLFINIPIHNIILFVCNNQINFNNKFQEINNNIFFFLENDTRGQYGEF